MSAIVVDILHHVGGMAWKVAWALVLGFALSACIQTYVSSQKVAKHLGELSIKSLFLASLFGCASSSCSYAAAAMSKTLFQKGAHFINTAAFLFAATNLVIEIGLVIWVLLGWQFVLAEFVGGVLLIVILAVLLRWLAPAGLIQSARQHLESSVAKRHEHDHHGHAAPSAGHIRQQLSAVGRYFAMDVSMIARDIGLGLLIAGTLAATVPQELWGVLFLSGDQTRSAWVILENVVVGPIIGVLSFVCSVGNIPLAAVLWQGGISFAGVMAFIFADLITIPMVLVYRRYYGWKPALMFAAYLMATMVLAALIIQGLFGVFDLVPQAHLQSESITRTYFAWDYTTLLNIIFLPLGVVLFGLGRRSMHR